ncbi:MAG: hypothetical protein L0228_07620 [Planctomycetes bacterium]|nr:hypothetical protein [Planctomycetota bacterium]
MLRRSTIAAMVAEQSVPGTIRRGWSPSPLSRADLSAHPTKMPPSCRCHFSDFLTAGVDFFLKFYMPIADNDAAALSRAHTFLPISSGYAGWNRDSKTYCAHPLQG